MIPLFACNPQSAGLESGIFLEQLFPSLKTAQARSGCVWSKQIPSISLKVKSTRRIKDLLVYEAGVIHVMSTQNLVFFNGKIFC